MLAPTTITLRRPSGDSDLIISRLESGGGGGSGGGEGAGASRGSPGSIRERRPSDGLLQSTYSQRLSLAVNSPVDVPIQSNTSSPLLYNDTTSGGGPSPSDTPRRRSSWACRGADGVKKELEKIANKLKKARNSLRGSTDCLLSRLPRRRKSDYISWEEMGGRRFNVDLNNGQVICVHSVMFHYCI